MGFAFRAQNERVNSVREVVRSTACPNHIQCLERPRRACGMKPPSCSESSLSLRVEMAVVEVEMETSSSCFSSSGTEW